MTANHPKKSLFNGKTVVSRRLYAFIGDTFISSGWTTNEQNSLYLRGLPIGATLIKCRDEGFSMFIKTWHSDSPTERDNWKTIAAVVPLDKLPVSPTVKAQLLVLPLM